MNSEHLPLGCHVSIAGGLDKSFARGEDVGCKAIQIFTKNASQWRSRAIAPDMAQAFARAWQQSTISHVFAHDSYLINLAADTPEKREKSRDAFLDEMQRCATLGIPGLVMHPGAHLRAGEKQGLERVAASFRAILAEAPANVRILLETTAGQGSYLGWCFEHLAAIMDLVPEHDFGVCLDTCHVFAAGYDISSEEGYGQVMAEMERLIGLDKIAVFHINDSKKECGARVDRHEHIGQGNIGETAFRCLMQDERFRNVPKILELPKGDQNEHDLRNLAILRKLAEGN